MANINLSTDLVIILSCILIAVDYLCCCQDREKREINASVYMDSSCPQSLPAHFDLVKMRTRRHKNMHSGQVS